MSSVEGELREREAGSWPAIQRARITLGKALLTAVETGWTAQADVGSLWGKRFWLGVKNKLLMITPRSRASVCPSQAMICEEWFLRALKPCRPSR